MILKQKPESQIGTTDIEPKFLIAWSEEDGGYVATCPEVPGLSAFSETKEDALAEAQIALELFEETCP